MSGIASIFVLLTLAAAPPTTTSGPSDAGLWAKLNDIDARAGKIHSLSASFQQQKFTALLRKPLVSTGQVRVRESVMRWDTHKPQPNVLLIDPGEARVYYPAQRVMEVYPIDKRLGELAASPLPRLDVLRPRFSFTQIPVAELDRAADPAHFVALRLEPTDPLLKEHVSEVRVLLDVKSVYIVRAEMIDADGDRTVLSFGDVHVNADVGDLALSVPPGTAVTHPLEGLDGAQPPPSPPPRTVRQRPQDQGK